MIFVSIIFLAILGAHADPFRRDTIITDLPAEPLKPTTTFNRNEIQIIRRFYDLGKPTLYMAHDGKTYAIDMQPLRDIYGRPIYSEQGFLQFLPFFQRFYTSLSPLATGNRLISGDDARILLRSESPDLRNFYIVADYPFQTQQLVSTVRYSPVITIDSDFTTNNVEKRLIWRERLVGRSLNVDGKEVPVVDVKKVKEDKVGAVKDILAPVAPAVDKL